jgi:hypothetical protein
MRCLAGGLVAGEREKMKKSTMYRQGSGWDVVFTMEAEEDDCEGKRCIRLLHLGESPANAEYVTRQVYQMAGWEKCRYHGKWYQVFGGIRTEYWIRVI